MAPEQRLEAMTNTGDPGNPKSPNPTAAADAAQGKARRRVMVDGEAEAPKDDRATKPKARTLAEILGVDREQEGNAAELPPGESAGPAWDPNRLLAFLQGQITLGDLEGITKYEQYEMAKIGFSYMTSGKLANAKTVFEGLVALDPFDAYFQTALGSIAQQAGDLAEAERRYSRALEINPFSAVALANRGEVLLLQGRLAEGTQDLVRALEEDPGGQYPSTLRARATINVVREQLQAANVTEFTEAAVKSGEVKPPPPPAPKPAPAPVKAPPPAVKTNPAATVTAPATRAVPAAKTSPGSPAAAAKQGSAWPAAKPAIEASKPAVEAVKAEVSKPAVEAAKPAVEAAKPAAEVKPSSDASPRGPRRGPRAGASSPAKKKK